MNTSFIIRHTILLGILLGAAKLQAQGQPQTKPGERKLVKVTIETEENGEKKVTEHTFEGKSGPSVIYLGTNGKVDTLDRHFRKGAVNVYTPKDGVRHVYIDSILGSGRLHHFREVITSQSQVKLDSLMATLPEGREGKIHEFRHGKDTQYIFLKDGSGVKMNADTLFFKDISAYGNQEVFIIRKSKGPESNSVHSTGTSATDPGIITEAKAAIQVYPNPSNGVFTISMQAAARGNALLTITNAAGKEVYREKLKNVGGAYHKEINLEQLPKGMYVARITQGKQSAHQKILIQ